MRKILAWFQPQIEDGVKLISLSTSIRYLGWGFVEAFLPLFLFSFAQTYAETGVLKSIFSVIFLLSLPVVSWLADRVASKKLLLAALLIYPLVSISYFFAGAFGIVAFVVAARALNGVAYALDSTGRATYVRTHATEKNIATSFGYIESLSNFWWLVAVAISLVLVRYVTLHYLFLLILPAALLAMIIVARLPNGVVKEHHEQYSTTKAYGSFFRTIGGWNKQVKGLAFLSFLVNVIATIGEFFMPIYAYTQNASITQVILLTAFAALPSLLSSPLGMIADRHPKTIIWATSITSCLLIVLAFTTIFPLQLILVFGISVCLQLLSLAVDREITFHVPKDQIGSLSGAFQGVSQAADIVSPLLLGVLIDAFNLPKVLLGLAIVCCALGLTSLHRHRQQARSTHLKTIPRSYE